MPERTCPGCGKIVPDAKFCVECGEPLLEISESEQAQAGEAAEVLEEVAASAAPPPPPPPAEESEETVDRAEAPEVVGAEESGTELPPHEPPTESEPFERAAAEEAEPLPEREGVVPDDLEPRGPHHEPVVAGATPMQQAAEDVRAPAPPIDGQLRCPNCGEAVYQGERVCWGCSRRLEVAEEAPEREPVEGVAPESGAPAARQAQPQTAVAQPQPYAVAETRQERAGRRPSNEVAAYAWWSFGLGLLSVFTCGILGLLGIASLWLGISAARRDGGPVAVAGAVFGAIGLLIFLAWMIGLAIFIPEIRPGPTHIILPVLP